MPYGNVRNRPAIAPRCTASRIPMAGVSRTASSSRPVRFVASNSARKPTSIRTIRVSEGSGSLRHFSQSSPSDPALIAIPPLVPSTTGRLPSG